MADSGVADRSRAARLILKDVVSGRLKWIAAPPDVDQSEFDKLTYGTNDKTNVRNARRCDVMQQVCDCVVLFFKPYDFLFFVFFFFFRTVICTENTEIVHSFQLEKRNLLEEVRDKDKMLDEQFFLSAHNSVHVHNAGITRVSAPEMDFKSKKHYNRGKREKLRRIYGD